MVNMNSWKFFQILMTYSQVMTRQSLQLCSAKIDSCPEEQLWHKNVYVHALASRFGHALFWCYYLEKPTSAHKFFCFFWLCIIYMMKINHKIPVNWLASVNIELQENFFWCMYGLLTSTIIKEAIWVWKKVCFK